MITQVDQKWPTDRLLINYELHNVCNYRCSYCFSGSNDGQYKWPTFDLALLNLKHLISYYQKHANKQKIQLNLLGGEPTLWPELPKFCQALKDEYTDNISIMITTNGFRDTSWWREYGSCFDHVLISCHPEYVNELHIIEVSDMLYKMNVHVDTLVLMDSSRWNRAIEIVNNLKTSECEWAIIVSRVTHESSSYTLLQEEYLETYLKRIPNLEWYQTVQKEYKYSVFVTHDNDTIEQVSKIHLLSKNLNHFKQWLCNVGVDNITIKFTGYVSASCNEKLYQLDFMYNFYDQNFKEIFNPVICPTICIKE